MELSDWISPLLVLVAALFSNQLLNLKRKDALTLELYRKQVEACFKIQRRADDLAVSFNLCIRNFGLPAEQERVLETDYRAEMLARSLYRFSIYLPSETIKKAKEFVDWVAEQMENAPPKKEEIPALHDRTVALRMAILQANREALQVDALTEEVANLVSSTSVLDLQERALRDEKRRARRSVA